MWSAAVEREGGRFVPDGVVRRDSCVHLPVLGTRAKASIEASQLFVHVSPYDDRRGLRGLPRRHDRQRIRQHAAAGAEQRRKRTPVTALIHVYLAAECRADVGILEERNSHPVIETGEHRIITVEQMYEPSPCAL